MWTAVLKLPRNPPYQHDGGTIHPTAHIAPKLTLTVRCILAVILERKKGLLPSYFHHFPLPLTLRSDAKPIEQPRSPSHRALESSPSAVPSLSLSLSLSLSQMVLRCSEIDGPPKPEPSPPPASAVGSSFSVPFDNPTLRWGGTRVLRCQLVSGHRRITDRRPSSASRLPPPPPPQTKNDPSPLSSRRPRLILRIPYRPQPKEPERDGPPVPEERRDHRQDTRPASSDRARVEIARLDSGPVTRSLRSRAGAEGEEKTARKVKLAEFNISLSKEEIVDDFIAITGAKPPRRPKQRPRPLHKKLHVGFLFFSSCSRKI